MYLLKAKGVPWPPIGWKHFASIKKLKGQAISKDPKTATVSGINYKIDVSPVYLESGKRADQYSIRISGWRYSIHNESQEYPVLSFELLARDQKETRKEPYLSNLRVQAQPLIINESRAHQSIMAALFFMKQIESNHVPDHEQVLKLYRLGADRRFENSKSSRKRKSPFSLERPDLDYYQYLLSGRSTIADE